MFGSFLIIVFAAVQGVPGCEWGKYGHNCDRLCSEHCRLHPVRNLRHCQKVTGKCSEGCVRGRHGDHCDQLCSPNCIKTTCNQPSGECTIGCMEGYSGYFCNITTGTQAQITVTTTYRPCDWGRMCPGILTTTYRPCGWGRFGETCDQACPPGCALGSDRNTNYCQTDTGTCTRGCRRGWHGDRCEKLCGRNCIADICHQGSGHCTHGCRGRCTGEFFEAETGDGHIILSVHVMWMLLVIFILSTICCWRSPRCRRTFDKGFTLLIRRYPRSSSSDLSERVPLLSTASHASSDLSQRIQPLSTASHATPSHADLDLYYASVDGDLEEVKWLLSAGDVNVNCRVWSMTPLMEAARGGHREVVKFLVSKSADVSLVNDGGNNTLHWACVSGNLVTVKFVLSRNKLDINSRGFGGRTPVMAAAVMGHGEVVKLLMNEGANVSLKDVDGNNILHLACGRGDVKFVQSLNAVDINARNNNGRTAIDMVRSMGNKRLVDLLVSRGAQ